MPKFHKGHDRIPAHLVSTRDLAINAGYRGGQSMMVKDAYKGRGVTEATRKHEKNESEGQRKYVTEAVGSAPFDDDFGYGR